MVEPFAVWTRTGVFKETSQFVVAAVRWEPRRSKRVIFAIQGERLCNRGTAIARRHCCLPDVCCSRYTESDEAVEGQCDYAGLIDPREDCKKTTFWPSARDEKFGSFIVAGFNFRIFMFVVLRYEWL